MAHTFLEVYFETWESKYHDYCISSGSVHEALKMMRRGKCDGYDGHTSNCIKNGTQMLTRYMALFFTGILKHVETLNILRITTLILIS